METKEMTLIGHFAVDSGQAMVGDPCYLDEWDTNRAEEWNIEGKEGEYSYHGASATTLSNNHGELGMARAVVFSTGYGDGLYPVYAEMNEDGRVARIVIEFIGDEE
ncbi:MAG: DUF4241 domain-containing protein [Minisyncoccia bacterium]